MPAKTSLVVAASFVLAVGTVAYWILFFFVPGTVQTGVGACYLPFERAFPLADAWMALCGALCGVALLRKRPSSLLWGLLSASAMIYLGGMDVLYDLENGLYTHLSFDVAAEVIIDAYALGVGAWFIAWFWRQRGPLLALQG